ncbi:MAG TPA: hypothetical protein VMF89_27105, partial [Polyangiales bacterium]|nr:hypothetical protein [Polyangiales bacterium]
LDKRSALEVSYPATDACVKNELEIQGAIELSTADGKFSVSARSAFKYTPYPDSPAGPLRSPAELIVPTAAVSGAAAHGQYAVLVGGAGPGCAGELRWLGDARTGPASPGGTWSATGCPLGHEPVDPDSSPEVELRMQQLSNAWRDARLDAAWENGDKTQLELDVEPSSAPICKGRYGSVTVPVEVRYGTADGVIPAHDALGSVSFDVTKNEVSLRLSLEEETDCAARSMSAPRYCENLSAATLRLDAIYPNVPAGRLTSLIVDGTLIGSDPDAKTQEVLHAAGTPHAVECLFTYDCAVDELCADGFCRERSNNQASQRCATDSDCIGKGGHCRIGNCSI